MVLETVRSEGLAHLSYLIGDDREGVCAVIDPRRDVGAYLGLARGHGLAITHVLETHIPTDYVSGARELAVATGARIAAPAGGAYGFEVSPLRDCDTVALGCLKLEVLHTPGHTPEHVCLLVSGGGRGLDAPWGVFTGDTLFAGEVGRPDLLGPQETDRLGKQLYSSLHDRLLRLDDGVIVYPAHGEGSPCGGNIGGRDVTTIGYERRHNPRLQATDEGAFLSEVLASLPPAPAYYPRVKQMNAAGPAVLGCVPSLPGLALEQFRAIDDAPNGTVVDVRPIEAFAGGHIPGALSIALQGTFAIWAGWMLDPNDQILLVAASEEDAQRAQRELLRVGLENAVGFLRGGIGAWFSSGLPFARILQMSVHDLRDHVIDSVARGIQVVDVRRESEWREGHIPTAVHIYLPELRSRMGELDASQPTAVYCDVGFRSQIAASILQGSGFREVHNVPGSMRAWRAFGYPIEK